MENIFKIRIPDDVFVDVYKDYVSVKKNMFIYKKCKYNNTTTYLFKNYIYFFNKNADQVHQDVCAMSNLIWGLERVYYRQLILVGVGYKVQVDKQNLNFKLGFSHPINYNLPISIGVANPKPQLLILFGNNLNQVAQIAANVRKLKSPEPFKGKGICYATEKVKLKSGKKK